MSGRVIRTACAEPLTGQPSTNREGSVPEDGGDPAVPEPESEQPVSMMRVVRAAQRMMRDRHWAELLRKGFMLIKVE